MNGRNNLNTTKGWNFDRVGARLPIGVLSAAAIPYSKGADVRIIDQRTDDDWVDWIEQYIDDKTVCVGITCMTGSQIKYALEVSKYVKDTYPHIPIIWGGVHATLMSEQTLVNPYIDMIIRKEGDHTFYEVYDALKNKKSLDGIRGLWYKREGQIFKNPDRPFIKDLDELPELPYSLLEMEKYTTVNFEHGGKSVDFVSSRGCPSNCSFCYNQFFNDCRWRSFSAIETVRRLKNVVKTYNIKSVFFQDDNFCVNIPRLKDICKGIIREKLNIKWGTLGLRVDTAKMMDKEVLDLMEKSGCMNVDIGVESGSQTILNMIDKNIKAKDVLGVNEKLSKYPFIIKYTFIVGFPGETDDDIKKSIKLANDLVKGNKNAYTLFLIYTPYPGTPLFEKAVDLGFVPPDKLEEWSKFNYDNWATEFPSWHSKSHIRKLVSISFTSFFANKNVMYKLNNKWVRFLFRIYLPIAQFRFKHNFHFMPLDSMIGRRLID